MDFIEHYTTLEKLGKMMDSEGLLLPKSDPFPPTDIEVVGGALQIIGHQRYLVGIPENSRDLWIQSGLWDDLIAYWKLADEDSPNVMLRLPIFDPQDAFVRDLRFFSESYRNKKDHRDFPEKSPRTITRSLDNNAIRDYYESTTRLSDYEKNQFEVPEIWVYQTTPLKKCNISEVVI